MQESEKLRAVIFDVDGTLAETERHGHRVAFNKAFEQLEMPYRWDEDLYGDLLKVAGGDRRLFHYLTEYEGMDSEKASELAAELHRLKTKLFVEVVRSGGVPARAGVLRLMKQLDQEPLRLAVATTGNREWVLPWLQQLTDEANLRPFEAVVTGDEVANLKPDPELFKVALDRLEIEPHQALIIEDSKNGVKAAKAAGCCCLVVRGEYAAASELMEADLLVDEFGETDSPLEVFGNPLEIEVGPLITPDLLRRLHEHWLAQPTRSLRG